MRVAAAVLAALCAVAAAEAVSYTNSVELSSDLTLSWATAGPGSTTLHFQAVLNHVAWLGVGVSDDGSMTGTASIANAVLCNNGVAGQVAIVAPAASGLRPSSSSGTTNMAVSEADGKTTMTWTRGFDNGNSSMTQINLAGLTNIIFAYGTSGQRVPTEASIGGMSSVAVTMFQRSVALGAGLTLNYNLLDSNTVQFQAVYQTRDSWVGVGVSTSTGNMFGEPGMRANAVICNNTVAREYNLVTGSVAGLVPKPANSPSTTKDMSCVHQDGATVVAWTRNFNNGVATDVQLDLAGPTPIIYAGGASDTPIVSHPSIRTMAGHPVTFKPYTHTKQLYQNLTLSWNFDRTTLSFDFQAALSHVAWFGVGVSPDGHMVGPASARANAIVCTNGQAAQYYIHAASASGFTLNPTSGTTNVACTVNNGKTVMTWTRKYNNGDPLDAQLQLGDATYIIYATGLPGDTVLKDHTIEAMASSPTFLVPYDNAVPLNDDLTLRWTKLTPALLSFQAVMNHTAWLGVGVSPTGHMVGTDTDRANAVICSNGVAKQYELLEAKLAGIVAHPTSGCLDMQCVQADGQTVMMWKRGFDNGDPNDTALSFAGDSHMIFAAGEPGQLQLQGSFSFMSTAPVNFNPGASPSPTPSPTPNPVPSPAPDAACTATGPHGMVLGWGVDHTGHLKLSVTVPETRWVGLGFRTSGVQMVHTDAVIGRWDPHAVQRVMEYYITGKDVRDIVPYALQPLKDTVLVHADGTTTLTFTRPMTLNKPHMINIPLNDTIVVLYALGYAGQPAFTQHEFKGGLNVNIGECTVSQVGIPKLRLAHGSLMFIAWGFLLPLGVAAAVMGRNKSPSSGPRAWWFVRHKLLNYLGLAVALAGFICAVYMCRGGTHFQKVHSKVGLAVMVLGLLQPLNAFIRPAAGAGAKRAVWQVWHKGIGAVTLVLAAVTMPLGLKLIGAVKGIKIAYYAYLGVIAAVLVIGKLVVLCRSSSDKEKRLLDTPKRMEMSRETDESPYTHLAPDDKI